jgi:hypothetical protein
LNTLKIRALPSEAMVPRARQLSWWERTKLIIAMNREPIGIVLFALSFLFRAALTKAGHSDVADRMKELGIGMMGGSIGIWLSGKTGSDEYHQKRAENEIREASGQRPIPAFARRAEDLR